MLNIKMNPHMVFIEKKKKKDMLSGKKRQDSIDI